MLLDQNQRGQSTLEFAILIVIVAVMLLTVQGFFKRSVQGNLKDSADRFGDQFSPGQTDYNMVETSTSSTKDTFLDGVSRSELTAQDQSTTEEEMLLTGSTEYNASQEELQADENRRPDTDAANRSIQSLDDILNVRGGTPDGDAGGGAVNPAP